MNEFRSLLAGVLIRLARRLKRPRVHPPTASQLHAVVPHVAYELAALDLARARFNVGPGGRLEFEAFPVHVRALRDFLWNGWEPNMRFAASSVFAENFFGTPAKWRTVKGGLPTNLQVTRDAIDKQLAHITLERGDPATFSDLEGRMPGLYMEIMSQRQRFMSALAGDPRETLFRTAVAQKRQELGLPR